MEEGWKEGKNGGIKEGGIDGRKEGTNENINEWDKYVCFQEDMRCNMQSSPVLSQTLMYLNFKTRI